AHQNCHFNQIQLTIWDPILFQRHLAASVTVARVTFSATLPALFIADNHLKPHSLILIQHQLTLRNSERQSSESCLMEGIIPFIFKAIAQYKEGGSVSLSDMMSDEPSPALYPLLPRDAGGRRHTEEKTQLPCQTSTGSDEVTTCTARQSHLRCSTLRRRA
uniref:Uncharacterized protein n=1 Tax=Oryza brachyantha TaxID=4533 RepID=J3L5T3_ORYBR